MLQSQLFAGDAVLQAVANDADRISRVRHTPSESVRRIQQAILTWRADALPINGADSLYDDETAAAVVRFKIDELGVPAAEVIDDVGPRTVARLDEIQAAAEAVLPPPPTVRYGKHRGLVLDDQDPMQLGRIRASVPSVGAQPLGWAMPCVPCAGAASGVFVVPPVGSNVWIEFEEGDESRPIWTGGFWSTGQVPASAGPGGGFTIAAPTGERIVVDHTGIHIDNGKGATIELVGPRTSSRATLSRWATRRGQSSGAPCRRHTPVPRRISSRGPQGSS
jgi:hypothetical protein